MKTVVCSHGFGVRADDRGLFTDIAAEFPEYHFITFDYNEIDEEGNMTVLPLDTQASLLENKISSSQELRRTC